MLRNTVSPRRGVGPLVLMCALLAGSLAPDSACPLEHTELTHNTLRWSFNIEDGSLDSVLLQFSRQTRIQVILSPGVPHMVVRGIRGEYTVREALDTLLRPTGLLYTVVDNTVTVHPPGK